MKVLQVNSVCGTGSTGRITLDLYQVLQNHGHDCLIAYGRGSAPEGVKAIKIGSEFSVRLHGLLSRITDKHGLYSKKATRRLIKQVREYDPDMIHLHNIHGYYINYELLFAYLAASGKPVVWTLHDCWPFTGHCAYFDNAGCEKWKTGCQSCSLKSNYPKSYFIDASLSNYERKKKAFTSLKNMTIITPSKWLADLTAQSFLGKYTIKSIPNGIDLDKFKPIDSNIKKNYNLEGKFTFLGVASVWDERKGLNDFIKLSQQLDDHYKIILIGLTKKQAKSMPSNIIALTRTNNTEELAMFYTAADVFVNPTYEDNFPTTNLEALACGTPVITYATGGSPESIDSLCGITVAKGDIKALTEAVRNGFASGFFQSADVRNSCLKRSENYDKNKCFNEYIEIIEGLLNENYTH